MEYVVIGKVIDTFGVKGGLKVLPFAPREVFDTLKRVYFKRVGGGYVPFKAESVKKHGDLFLLKLEGCNSLEKAEQFKGAHLFLPEVELPEREEGEFYAYELVGMEVWTDGGRKIGRVERIEDLGVYDILILEDKKTMIPFVSDIVLEVDRRRRRIEVREDMVLG